MRSHFAFRINSGTLALFFLLTASPARTQILPVTLSPGANIQSIVDASPENTTFIFLPGTYRFVSIRPKNGDSFLGQNNPVFTGARVLTSFNRQGNLWVATGQTQQGQQIGMCDDAHPRCTYPEDLFLDNVPLLHVASLDDVGHGSWFFDYPNHQIFLGDDPNGHLVETSVSRSAFYGNATNVTVDGFIVEKYAVPAQYCVIGDQSPGPGWKVNNNEIRLNHGGGINVVDNTLATNNFVHHNGQKGIGGSGGNGLVQGNEVSFNNWAGFLCMWECGGMKFGSTSWLVVRGNTVHDNYGPGIWSDVDNIYTLYENNTIMNNSNGAGIQHEISYSAVIRNNNICNNWIPGPTNWLWGSQIMLQNTQDVQIYGNTVETAFASFDAPPSVGSNGISIISQNRPTHPTEWNWVHNNTIVFKGVSTSGMVADFDSTGLLATGNNSFDYNTYHLVDPFWYHWRWVDSYTFAGLQQQAGQEVHGTADNQMPAVSACAAAPHRN